MNDRQTVILRKQDLACVCVAVIGNDATPYPRLSGIKIVDIIIVRDTRYAFCYTLERNDKVRKRKLRLHFFVDFCIFSKKKG